MLRTTELKKLMLGLCVGIICALLCVPQAMSSDSATVTTGSGLQYVDLKVGKGELARAGDQVLVHYTGWLQNPDGSKERKFDSSRERGQAFAFVLGEQQSIKGWDEGVQGMRVGGERRLIIQAALA